jgi:hypothetical protein
MNKIKHMAIKEDGKSLRVVNPALLREESDKLPAGRYDFIIQKHQKNKSNPQLGYYFACVIPLSWKLLLDAGWEFTSEEEVDAFWKSQFANRELINRNTGEIMSIPTLKRNMTTVDMMVFVDAIRNYCSEYLGGYIPEPEENLTIEYKE